MENAIHRAAGTLDRLLERVHGASDVFFEGVSHQDVIFFGITVIGTCPRKIVDPVECVVIAAGATRSIFAGRVRGCATSFRCGSGSLLGKEFRCAGYKSHNRRHLAKEISPRVDGHRNLSFEYSLNITENLTPSGPLLCPAAL